MKANGLFLILTVLAGLTACAELHISEICPRPDKKDPNGKESGWIELYNDGTESVDLADYEIVRANRGKELKRAKKPLASRMLAAKSYTVVYTSEEYDNVDSGDVVIYDNDVMVYPNKVSPKKYPLVALYKGKDLLEKFIVPSDLPDNQSIAPTGGCFPYYNGTSPIDPTKPILVDATPIDITGKLSLDADSGVKDEDGIYDYAGVTAKNRGLKANASVTAELCTTNTWSAQFSFKLNTNKATSGKGSPLFFCRTSGAEPKSGIVVYINIEKAIEVELRDASGNNNQTFEASTDENWFDGEWHVMKIVSSGNCMTRFALSVDDVTYIDTSCDYDAGLNPIVPVCFGHAYDSDWWELFDGAFKDISFYKGTLIGREAQESVVPAGQAAFTDKMKINNPVAVTRVILPTITCGKENDYSKEIACGPNAGPLYGVKHKLSDWEPHAPAKVGEDYSVTLAVNPFSEAEGDEIADVKLIYRAFQSGSFGEISSVSMAKDGDPDESMGQLWTGTIPASALPPAGFLLQWAAQVTDKSGNIWRTPSFNNPDDGYEWYGTIVEPTEDQISKTLQTWHIFADSTAKNNMDKQYESVKGFLKYGARVAIYDSQTSLYYDNVRIDLRGNTTAGLPKKSHGLRFSKVHPMTCTNPFDGEKIEVRKTSILAEHADPSRLRSSLSMKLRRMAGQDVPFGYPIRVQRNGEFYQLDHHTNRYTDEMLTDYFGYSEYGYAWKNVGSVGGQNFSGGSKSQVLPDDGTKVDSTYAAFESSIKDVVGFTWRASGLSADASNKVNRAVVQQYDLPAWINFLALARLTQECDDGWANLCLYYDRLGTGTWAPIAYDLHQSLGAYYAIDGYTNPQRKGLWAEEDEYGKSHPLYGGVHIMPYIYRDGASARGNRAFEAVYQNAKYRRLHNRRLRTLMDEILMAPGTSQDNTPFWHDYVVPLVAAMQEDDVLDRKKWDVATTSAIYVWTSKLTFADGVKDLWDNYFVRRRKHFFETHSVNNTSFKGGYGYDKNAQIPNKQSATSELKAKFSAEAIEGGVVIRNLNAETVDMSGWTLSGAINYVFPAGSVIDQAFGSTPGEVFVVTDRIGYVSGLEKSGTSLTDQVILGNAESGSGAVIGLVDAAGEEVITPPEPEKFFTGDYDEPVTIDEPCSCVLSNANFKAGLVLGEGTYILKNVKKTVNTASNVVAAGSIVFKQKGTFELKGAGTEPLMTVGDLFVSNGVFKVDYTGAAAKSKAVNVTGSFAVEDEGTVDVSVDGEQSYGIYLEKKDKFCRIGGGGTFYATVKGEKCAALYGNKGSVDAEVEDDSTVEATLIGNAARLFNFAGKIKLKGGNIAVTGEATSLSNKVFKSDKSISVKKGATIAVEVPGAGSEAFSCANAFEMEGGQIEVVSADDCVGAETNVVISGGRFYGRSLDNDVFDTNEGDITVDGGIVLAYTTAQEPTDTPSKTVGSFGFDVNDNTLYLNGGIVVAIGGDNLTGDHFPEIAGSQNCFVDRDAESGTYSGKYIAYSVCGTNTTVGLPLIDSTKCTVLYSVPGMTEGPKILISDVAPKKGSLDFHEVYVSEPEPFVLGEPEARPGTDYNGSTVKVLFTGDIPEGAEATAKVTLDGKDYAGTIDADGGTVTFDIPADIVKAGDTFNGTVTVTVWEGVYTKPVSLVQGTIVVDKDDEWIRESASTFETTGLWTGGRVEIANNRICVSNALFTAATSSPQDSVVTISTKFDFGGVNDEDAFDPSFIAGAKVVSVNGTNRYAFQTGDGVVTNLEVVANVYGTVLLTIRFDLAKNTLVYAIDDTTFGPFCGLGATSVSSIGYLGQSDIVSLDGSYYLETLDTNLAKSGETEYATVAEALDAGTDLVTLLWDASWNPTKAGSYTIGEDGHKLVIGGTLAYKVQYNADGTITVTVTGGEEPDVPVPASITIADGKVKVAVKDAQANCWYALEKTDDLKKSFVVDATTWVSGEDLISGTKNLEIALGANEPQGFYRVVVSSTKPQD